MKDNSLLLDLLKHIHPRPRPVYSIYDIPTDPDRTIEFVEFDYDCRFYLKAFAWLCVEEGLRISAALPNAPAHGS